MKPAKELDQEIIRSINKGTHIQKDDDEFNGLALQLFEYQYHYNLPYQKFCQSREIKPGSLKSWKEIPPVPTVAFKECDLACFPISNAVKTFHTSGTSIQKYGRHYLDTLDLYNASILPNFKGHVLPDLPGNERILILSLTPAPSELPNSSLIYMINLIMDKLGSDQSDYFIQQGELNNDKLIEKLRKIGDSRNPVLILGPAFSFVHFFDYCRAEKIKFQLPDKTRLMETGGFKGKSRGVTKEELYQLIDDIFGIPEINCINEYGMTELGVQYYDNKLYNYIHRLETPPFKFIPPWARIRILDPETMEEIKFGQQGLLCHYDLTNRGSVLAILTEDIGYQVGDGFEIIGRQLDSSPRGCSISMDELLGK